MVERLKPPAKKTFSQLLGFDVKREGEQVRFGERTYKSAICLIGDGTGLEALKAAQSHPESAIVILDPFASEFAGNIFNQLEQIKQAQSVGQTKTFDWSFLTNSEDVYFHDTYEILSDAIKQSDQQRSVIEQEYLKSSKGIREMRQRIYLANAVTDKTEPEKDLFDEIHMIYPEPDRMLDEELPPLFSFLNRGLQQEGTIKIVTDIDLLYKGLLKFAYDNITQHGRVNRDPRKEIKHPLSIYDLLNGQNGYFYVNLIKKKPFLESTPWGFLLRETPWAILGLFRPPIARKRKDIKE